MKATGCISKAEKYRQQMDSAIEPLNLKLRELLDDDNATVFHQPGDGWCVLFADDHNAPVRGIDFDVLLQMHREEALNYLMELSI
jgi:hypothetical protein